MPKRQKSGKGRGRGAEQAEIAELEARIAAGVDGKSFRQFTEFPLSRRTQQGLLASGFKRPTDIQKEALSRCLEGKDVLGAAKTGSGKTIAFLVPVLEKLFRLRWSKMDGCGAIIISPTRELALQTYDCLTKIGSKHEMSAGLVIGGTTYELEARLVTTANILVCTPGRLLQHMDETPMFSCDNLQALVLDEADRILDLGFQRTLNAILQNLPKSRQTMLFSATQAKSVESLARLSLRDPVRVSVHETAQFATPNKLTQAYMEVELPSKVDVLYSFVRSHTTVKTIVFVSSCKQVRFLYEMFRRTRPGVPLLALYGKQKQQKRISIFKDFSKKEAAVLFATDIAARGLDIPAVDWVVQFDCPDTVETYIHRVGRTARLNKDGKALLMLLPSEVAMVDKLLKKPVPIIKTEANTDKIRSITGMLRSLCAEDPELKYLAQKTFISYMRSVFLQGDKAVFKVDQLPADAYALAIGLPSAPKIKFLKKANKQRLRGAQPAKKKSAPDYDALAPAPDAAANDRDAPVVTRWDRMRKKQNADVLSGPYQKLRAGATAEEEEEGSNLFAKAAVQTHEAIADDGPLPTITSKKQRAKATKAALLRSQLGAGTKHVFDEDGNAHLDDRLAGIEQRDGLTPALAQTGQRELDEARRSMQLADIVDREVHKEKQRARRRERKERDRALRLPEGFHEEAGGVYLDAEPGAEYASSGAEEEGAPAFGGSDGAASSVDEAGASDEEGAGSRKRKGGQKQPAPGRGKRSKQPSRSLAEDEELALALLGGGA